MAALIDLLNRKKADEENINLINEIQDISRALERAYERFELQSDSDLVEATIFEIEALKARYRYMLALAKEQNLTAQGKRE
ncbi:MAG: DUF2508 family protein [Clostridia bacterium]|nr:DUF2508 family protein [Clostridia bacterium]MBQ6931569.1 DUF2508 family protein [Clostridia bacterium]MBR3754703.1 DUF2508 family protein [Clostridia bacterium]MBR4049790.1 DUF2508 family protein [Clostridia bacterium]